MSKSSAEFDLGRIQDKIEKIEKELEENRQLDKRNERDKLWELDKVRREYETRAHNFQEKKEKLHKELKGYYTQRDRLQFKIEKEKQEEEEKEQELAKERYQHRMGHK